MSKSKEARELARAVLLWWESEGYRTGNSDSKYNLYDEVPKFVTLAYKTLEEKQ